MSNATPGDPDPLEAHDLEMQTHRLLGIYREHQKMATLAMALAIETYLFTPGSTPEGAAKLIQEAAHDGR